MQQKLQNKANTLLLVFQREWMFKKGGGGEILAGSEDQQNSTQSLRHNVHTWWVLFVCSIHFLFAIFAFFIYSVHFAALNFFLCSVFFLFAANYFLLEAGCPSHPFLRLLFQLICTFRKEVYCPTKVKTDRGNKQIKFMAVYMKLGTHFL